MLNHPELHTQFKLRQGTVQAVAGVNLTIYRGQTLGIVGESGCGKSVTAQSILRIVPPPGRIVSGEILLHDIGQHHEVIDLAQLDPKGTKIRAVRGGEIGMIFQEPMATLSPVYSVGNQILEAALLHLHTNNQPISKPEAREMVLDMLARVGFSDPARTFQAYPHELSGGMRQRAVIAMALIGRPKLLIADEPTTALDVTTEAQILRLLKELQVEFGMAILFITHDLGVIAKMANDVAVMYLGKVVEQTDVNSVFYNPQHPYLRALLDSVPRFGGAQSQRLRPIEGIVPDPANLPSGCSFHPRCREFVPGTCDVVSPTYITTGSNPAIGTNQREWNPNYGVACHLYTSIS
ncbi:ABC transporter ATP-binding protein [Chloroflexi bacterium TSY]|nr:ABC transporter ATP-binding protein [Chloroflexi bacterium TSY]